MDKITIVTVTYNCSNILEDTIKSCISQNYIQKEYIIIDGNSNDGTINIIKKYSSNITYWQSEPDKGIYDAMNKGIQHATGDWIIFMNAGDYFADNFVLSNIFSRYIDPATGVIWGLNNTITNKGIIKNDSPKPFWKQKRSYRNMGFNHQSVLVNLNILHKENILFDLSYKLTADYKMIYTLYQKGYKFEYMNFPISTIDGIHGLSANNRRRQRQEEARVCGCENKLSFIILTNYESLKSFIKKLFKK